MAGLQGSRKQAKNGDNPYGDDTERNHHFGKTESMLALRCEGVCHVHNHGVGVAVGSARPVVRDTLIYSDASGFPLASFAPATTSLPLARAYPSKTPNKTLAGEAGASTSPFALNFKYWYAGVVP